MIKQIIKPFKAVFNWFKRLFKRSVKTNLGTWNHKLQITIDKTNIDADLTDYPVLVKLSTSSGISHADLTDIFTELGSSGLKIAITLDDGVTQCYVEEVSWDAVTPFAELWVKVPTVAHLANTVLYLYYDHTHADNSTYVGVTGSVPGKAVWDANFVAVYHMNDNPDTSHIADSTGVNNGTKTGVNEPVEVAGIIGKQQLYDGSDDKIVCGNPATLGSGDITLENYITKANDSWIRDYGIYGNTMVSKGGDHTFTANGFRFYIEYRDNGTIGFVRFCVRIVGSNVLDHNYYYTYPGGVAAENLFTSGLYIVTTRTFSTKTLDMYSAGLAVAQDVSATAGNASSATNLIVGYHPNTSYLYGSQDELRISNIARSAAYIKANNYCWTDDLVTFGSPILISIVDVIFFAGD
jgi:hypothetical protein